MRWMQVKSSSCVFLNLELELENALRSWLLCERCERHGVARDRDLGRDEAYRTTESYPDGAGLSRPQTSKLNIDAAGVMGGRNVAFRSFSC